MSGRVHAEAKAAPKSSFTPVRTGLLAGYHGKPLVSQPPLIQAKLTINQPNDRYEQEADRVAEQVMRMPELLVQRQVEPGRGGAMLRIKPLVGQITPLVQRQVEPEGTPSKVQQPEQEQQPTEGAQSEEADGEVIEITDTSTSTHSRTCRGLCIRTPFGPGQVRFNSCTNAQLDDYAVIPETGTTLTMPPANGVWYDSDGFWQRHHRPKSEWFKVGNHCDLDVTCVGSGFYGCACCNIAASVRKGRPRWVSTPHSTSNPF